jgi:hypothetical protein
LNSSFLPALLFGQPRPHQPLVPLITKLAENWDKL